MFLPHYPILTLLHPPFIFTEDNSFSVHLHWNISIFGELHWNISETEDNNLADGSNIQCPQIYVFRYA